MKRHVLIGLVVAVLTVAAVAILGLAGGPANSGYQSQDPLDCIKCSDG